MTIKSAAQTIYGLCAATFLVLGAAILLLGTNLLPSAARDTIRRVAPGDGDVLHVMQEAAALSVFTGLITIWFMRHYDQSRPFHWAMTLFWAIFAAVHWFDVRGGFQVGWGQALVTLPMAVFVVVGLLRQGAEGR